MVVSVAVVKCCCVVHGLIRSLLLVEMLITVTIVVKAVPALLRRHAEEECVVDVCSWPSYRKVALRSGSPH